MKTFKNQTGAAATNFSLLLLSAIICVVVVLQANNNGNLRVVMTKQEALCKSQLRIDVQTKLLYKMYTGYEINDELRNALESSINADYCQLLKKQKDSYPESEEVTDYSSENAYFQYYIESLKVSCESYDPNGLDVWLSELKQVREKRIEFSLVAAQSLINYLAGGDCNKLESLGIS